MNTEPLVAAFDTLEAAERARQRLLATGIAADAVELSVLADDRSTTKGNFSVGNGVATADSPLSIDGVASYPENFAKVETAGQCILRVACSDAASQRRAQSILAESGDRPDSGR
jgi:hypothetical protein